MIVSPVVNVNNRCNRVCRCKEGRHLTAKAGPVGNTDFRFCTHEVRSTTKISTVFWQNVELERIGFSSLLTDVIVVTAFYYSKLDGQQASIKKPLLIRAKDSSKKAHWFENLGHYANKKWQRINDEAEKYPEDDNYTSDKGLEDRLKATACKLFLSHGIKIDSTEDDRGRICQICKQNVDVNVTTDNPLKLPGYTKYSYTDNITDKSILVYGNAPLRFQKRTRIKTSFYLPIPVDSDNVKTISVYYWNGDTGRKNPLLIEFVGNAGISYWLENITKEHDGTIKHDRWKPIGYTESKDFYKYDEKLKKRLDVLNCIYNGVVQIKIGKKEVCHESKHYLHKNRIFDGYGEVFGTFPVLYSYKYRPSLGDNTGFNISEVRIDDLSQSFKDESPPFMSITNFMVFVSPCFEKKPFIMCVETGSYRSKNYQWYHREKKESPWQEYSQLNGQKYDKVTNKITELFENIKDDFGIKDCHITTSDKGIQLEVTANPRKGWSFHTYYDNSTLGRKIPIFVTKSEDTPAVNFFKNSHRPANNRKFFVVNKNLQSGGLIGGIVTSLQGVENVNIYFWEGNTSRPIIIEVKRNGEPDPRYYSRGNSVGSSWLYSGNQERSLLESLDHWNCENNGAIPIELTDPTNLKRFHGKKESRCLKNLFVSISPSRNIIPAGANDYISDSYQLSDDKRISRLTYNGQPTNIRPSYKEHGPTLNIYSWSKRPKVPLLLEFKPKAGESTWYENLGETPKYQEWKRIEKKIDEFYKDNPKEELTEKFTKKLDEVNCRVHGVVQIDVSRKVKEPYCHTSLYAHTKRIMVIPQLQRQFPGFTGYEHTPVSPLKTLTVSSFYNGGDRQEVTGMDFPLEKVEKVTVYFPNCLGGAPVALHVEYEKMNSVKEVWFKKEEDNKWKEATKNFQSQGDQEIHKLLDIISEDTNACDNSAISLISTPYQMSIGSGTKALINQDNSDDTLDFKKMFEDDSNTNDEGLGYGFLYDEYEDEKLKEEQNEIAIVNKVSVSSNTVFTSGADSMILLLEAGMPSVTIDINRKPSVGNIETYISTHNSGKPVDLYKTEEPEKSGFNMLIHSSSDDIPFKVEKVYYGDSEVGDLRPDKDGYINSYSVWYWKEDSQMKNPLLVEIENNNGTYRYNFSKGNWKSWNGSQQSTPLEGEKLEKELDDLNCQLNSAITMDISEGKYDQTSNEGRKYCCKNAHGRVKIEKKFGTTNKLVTIEYYEHLLSDPMATLSKIKYYIGNESDRKRITVSGLEFPIKGPVSIYVFYCNSTPAVICVKSGKQNVPIWFKRRNKGSHDWIDATTDFNGITPEEIGNDTNCSKFKTLNQVLENLGCGKQTCTRPDSHTTDGGSHTYVISAAVDPKVTIKLGYKPLENFPKLSSYPDAMNPNITINVKRIYHLNAGSNFFKYEHTLDPNGVNFTLKAIWDDSGHPIQGILPKDGKDVTSVSAYYWRHDNGSGPPNKALLVGVTANSGTTTYYRNNKNGKWEKYNHIEEDGKPTQDELDLLNCEINDVVQIDVTKTGGEYCHEPGDSKSPHNHKKVKVSKIVNGKLGNYTAYEHIQNPSTGTFNISGFTKGGATAINFGKHLTLPVRNATQVIVYFCKNRIYIPLLIYVPQATGEKWFRKPITSNDWEPADILNTGNKKDSDYDVIVDLLDTLQSPCKPPEVTIDIYRGSPEKSNTYSGGSGRTIDVSSDFTGNFTEYSHTVNRRNYFTLQDVNYNDGKISAIGTTKYVTQVSVYYWTALETRSQDTSRPLLMKVVTMEPSTRKSSEKWYENTNTSYNTKWEEWKPTGTDISQDNLEKKLKHLNCKLNNVVVIDVSQKQSPGYYDVCNDHYGGEKMRVEEDVNESVKLHSYHVYKHSLKDSSGGGKKFHVVSFKNGSHIMNLTGILPLPILDVDEVRVYFCSQDPDKPLLLYYKTKDTHNWYKNENTDSKIGKWVPEESLSQYAPSDSSDSHDKILEVLKTLPSKCNPATQGTKAALADGGASIFAGLGLTSGTLTGAGGLTGFGWWIYKRTKGDPWVRQI